MSAARVPLVGSKGNSIPGLGQLPLATSEAWQALAGGVSPPPLPLSSQHHFLCVSGRLSPLLLGCRTHPKSAMVLSPDLSLMTSAKSLFPNQVPFGGCWWTRIGDVGRCSTHHRVMPSRNDQGSQIMSWPPQDARWVSSPHVLPPCLSPAIGLLASMATVLLGGIWASSLLFRRLLWDVVRSPIGFFERTPVGNLLNRFSKETDTVDVDIPDKLRSLLMYAFGLLEVSLVVAVATPLAVVAILPMLILYAVFQVGQGWRSSCRGDRSQSSSVRRSQCGGFCPAGVWEWPLKNSQRQTQCSVSQTSAFICASVSTPTFSIPNTLSCCSKPAVLCPVTWKPGRRCKVSKTVMSG